MKRNIEMRQLEENWSAYIWNWLFYVKEFCMSFGT